MLGLVARPNGLERSPRLAPGGNDDLQPGFQVHQPPGLYMGTNLPRGPAARLAVGRQDPKGIEMHDMSEQQPILPAALAGGLEAGGIEFVGDQGVGEVLTGRFEPRIRLEVAQELFLAVGTNAPRGADQRSLPVPSRVIVCLEGATLSFGRGRS